MSHATPSDPVYWVDAYAFYYIQPFSTVTYAFLSSGTNALGESLRPMTQAEKDQALDAIAKVAANINVTMVEGDAATANILFGISDDPDASPTGITLYNGQMQVIAYDNKYPDHDVSVNDYIFKHELLHAFGLDHSTAIFGGPGPSYIPDTEDDGTTLFGNWTAGWTNDIQLFDLAALQYLYGPNPSVRAGADTYVINPGVYDPFNPDTHLTLIWDGGGFDTIDFSTFDVPIAATLVPGDISRIDGATGGILDAGTFAINYRTEIERLIGGSVDDVLTGNEHNNHLYGSSGNDTLVGNAGNDTLKGDDGDDRIFAGFGNDRSEGGLGSDLVRAGPGSDTLFGGDGNDTLGASNRSDLLLGEGGDDLLLGSNGNDRLYGDDGADTLLGGNGRDTLEGGGGNDRLRGDGGNDVFVFAPGEGADIVLDFQPGAGPGDSIKLIGFGAAFDAFSDVLAASTQAGANVVIDLGGGDQITLQGVNVANLDASDFAFG